MRRSIFSTGSFHSCLRCLLFLSLSVFRRCFHCVQCSQLLAYCRHPFIHLFLLFVRSFDRCCFPMFALLTWGIGTIKTFYPSLTSFHLKRLTISGAVQYCFLLLLPLQRKQKSKLTPPDKGSLSYNCAPARNLDNATLAQRERKKKKNKARRLTA